MLTVNFTYSTSPAEPMAGGRATPAPTADERDSKEFLRVAAAAGYGTQASSAHALSAGHPSGTGPHYPLAPATSMVPLPASRTAACSSEDAPAFWQPPWGRSQTQPAESQMASLSPAPANTPLRCALGQDSEEEGLAHVAAAPSNKQSSPLETVGAGAHAVGSKRPADVPPSGWHARPRPRFRSRGAVAPSLASVPGLRATASRAPPPLRGAAKASAGQAAAAMAAKAKAIATVAAAEAAFGSPPPSKAVKRAASKPTQTFHSSTNSGTETDVSKDGNVARAKALNALKLTTDEVAAANVATTAGVAGLLALSGDPSNLAELVKTTMQKHGETIESLAKAVGKLQVQTHKAAASAVEEAPLESEMGPQLHPSPKRRKTADGAVARSPPSSDPAPEDSPLRPAVPAFRVPPLTPTMKLKVAKAAAVAKNLAKATAIAQKRAEGSVLMVAIRDELTPKVKAIIGNARKTIDVLPSPNVRQSIIVEAAMEVMKADEQTVDSFLLEFVYTPSKKRDRMPEQAQPEDKVQTNKIKTVGVNSTLMQVFHHVVGNFKRNVVAAWYSVATGKKQSEMSVEQAQYWCDNSNYSKAPLGRKGIVAGIAKGFKYLGASSRVHHPVGVGGEVAVDMCFGHYALGVQLIDEVLTSIKNNVPDTPTVDVMRYKNYVAQAVFHDSFLTKIGVEDRGLILVDGDDPSRAVFEQEFMPASTEASGNGAPANAMLAEMHVAEEGAADAAPAALEAPVEAVRAVVAASPNVVLPVAAVQAPADRAARRARAAAILAAAQEQAAALLDNIDDDDLDSR